VTDPDLLLHSWPERSVPPASLSRRAGGPAGPRGACAAATNVLMFVCPEAVACNRGRVPAFHCDVNRLFARHRAAFLTSRARLRGRTDDGHVSGAT